MLLILLPISKGASSFAMVAIGILLIIWLWEQKQSLWKLIRQNLPIAVLALPFLAYAVSLLYSENLTSGAKFLERELNLLLPPLIVLIYQDFLRKYAKFLLAAFIIGVSFGALFTLIFYFLPEDQSIALADRLSMINLKPYQKLSLREAFGVYSPFMIRIQFSNLIALACLSIVYLYSENFLRKWLIPTLVLLLFTSAILGGRGGQLGLMLAFGVWVLGGYFYKIHPILKEKLTALGSYALLVLLLLGAFIVTPYAIYKSVPAVTERYNQLLWEISLYQSGEYVQHDYVHFTSLRRIISYQNSWELIQQQPILGVGVGDYAAEMKTIYAKNHPEFPVNSHNHLLFVWANAGLLGVFTFLFSIVYWLWHFWRKTQSWTRIFGLSLMAFFLSIMMLEAMINQVDLMAFGLFLGIVFLWPSHPQKNVHAFEAFREVWSGQKNRT